MRSSLLIIAGLGAVLGGLAAFLIIPGAPYRPSYIMAPSTGEALIGGHFSLIDHTGKRVTEQDFRGRKMLVYFGFTHCPDICPSGLQVISAALDSLGDKSKAVTPVFITVDPERDTPEVMAKYVKSFHPRLVGLTGSPKEIEAAAKKAFRVYYKKVPDPQSAGEYSVDHTSIIYLMDEDGQFVQHFTHPITADKLEEQLARFL